MLLCLALVVGTVFCTTTYAGPSADKPLVTSSDAPEYPKWSYIHNFGRVSQLNPSKAGVFFKLAGGQTAMAPRSDYYLVHKDHSNYQAMYDLLYAAAKEQWEVKAYTESKLNEKGYAQVVYLIVNFPADD